MTATLPGGRRSQIQNRLVRVLRVLRSIQEEPGQWTRERLCAELGVSPRMMDNDILVLRAAGYDIRRHRGGYAIADTESEKTVAGSPAASP